MHDITFQYIFMIWKYESNQGASCCDVIFQTVKVRSHRGQILAVWFQTDLQPLMQNLCLASDSKKVKTKSSLNSLGITDMVLDNQWASNWWNAKIKLFWCVLNSEVRENKAPPNFGFVFVLQLFKVFRLGGFSWV